MQIRMFCEGIKSCEIYMDVQQFKVMNTRNSCKFSVDIYWVRITSTGELGVSEKNFECK